MIQIEAAPEYFLAFIMLLARIGGLMVFAPVWSSFAISSQIRILLTVALSLALFPLLEDKLALPPADPSAVVLSIASELMIGLVLGLVGQLMLGAMQLAGTLMGFQMGFSLVNIIDPQSQVEISVLSVMQNLIGMTLFIVLGAHHWYLQAMVESYQYIAPYSARLPVGLVEQMMGLASGMFRAGVQLALPLVAVGIVVDVLLGVVGRAAPQIHVLIAGMPLRVLVGFVMIIFAVQATLPFFQRHLLQFREDLFTALRLMGS